MGNPVKTYQSEIYENLGFFATWLPSDQMDVGEIGVFEGGRFRRVAKLADLGVSAEVATLSGRADLQITSKQGVEMHLAGDGAATGVGKVQLSIGFSSSGAFLFHASGLKLLRLENRLQVADEVIKLYAKDKWKKEWMIVESVHTARRATLIISEEKSAKLEFGGEISGKIAGLSLADPSVSLKVNAVSGKLFQLLDAQNLCPLYSCLRVKAPYFGTPELTAVRGLADSGSTLERPGIAELLDS
jgi:hypothetical protein